MRRSRLAEGRQRVGEAKWQTPHAIVQAHRQPSRVSSLASF